MGELSSPVFTVLERSELLAATGRYMNRWRALISMRTRAYLALESAIVGAFDELDRSIEERRESRERF